MKDMDKVCKRKSACYFLAVIITSKYGVNSEPIQSQTLVIDQGQGHHFLDGMSFFSSNIPLNNAYGHCSIILIGIKLLLSWIRGLSTQVT